MRKSALRAALSGPWHGKQCSARMGRMSRLYSMPLASAFPGAVATDFGGGATGGAPSAERNGTNNAPVNARHASGARQESRMVTVSGESLIRRKLSRRVAPGAFKKGQPAFNE